MIVWVSVSLLELTFHFKMSSVSSKAVIAQAPACTFHSAAKNERTCADEYIVGDCVMGLMFACCTLTGDLVKSSNRVLPCRKSISRIVEDSDYNNKFT